MSKTTKKTSPNVVWFNIPADDVKRAQKFYKSLFGWKITPFRGMGDFLHIDTGGHDASPDGGIGQRQGEDHAIVNYIGVESIDKFLKKVQKLGGKVCMPKTAVPQMGYFAVCQDSEKNGFGFWERDRNAK
jgi:predicted enzyme related to lactoylglutathione lyase